MAVVLSQTSLTISVLELLSLGHPHIMLLLVRLSFGFTISSFTMFFLSFLVLLFTLSCFSSDLKMFSAFRFNFSIGAVTVRLCCLSGGPRDYQAHTQLYTEREFHLLAGNVETLYIYREHCSHPLYFGVVMSIIPTLPGPCRGLWDQIKVGEFSPEPLLQPHDRPQPCHRRGVQCVWTDGDWSGDSLAVTSGGTEGRRAPDPSALRPSQESPDTLHLG